MYKRQLDANATNIVALVPGYVGGVLAYREELVGQRERARRLSAVSIAGGAGGAVLLLLSPPGVFEALVPFLVLAACALLAIQPLVPQAQSRRDRRGTLAATFLAAVYGGYFGAALGVMLLAILGLMTSEGLQRANALKALLSLVIAVVSGVLLGVFGPVAWAAAGIIGVTSLAGGRLGGAAAISHAAEICSPRTSAITPHATALTTATNVQMAIERLRDLVPMNAPPLVRSCRESHPRRTRV